jgi:ATP synthase F1 complex assembly factor 2
MGHVFRVPNETLAVAVATEWDFQHEVIRRPTMHLTSLSNTAIDNPTQRSKETVINSIIEFLDTDTICYRVDEPVELANLQRKEWDELLNWLQKRYNVELSVTSGLGVPHVPDTTKDVFRQHLNSFNDWALVGYQQAVESIKSFIIATAVIDRELAVERAVELARLELEFQISQWGNVEWHHDVDKMELRSRLAAAAIFVYLNSNEAKMVFDKQSSGNPV